MMWAGGELADDLSLTAYINLCWVIGQFLSALILNALVDNPTEWGYKIPFALQVRPRRSSSCCWFDLLAGMTIS
jgi:hypothetical protein